METSHSRILVIDDDKAILELVEQTLSPHYQVTCLHEWLEGIELLSHNVFDLLILDLAMPVFSPEEFLKRLHDLPARTRIPVLVISAYPNLRQRLDGKQVAAILSKPFGVQELLDTVERLLKA